MIEKATLYHIGGAKAPPLLPLRDGTRKPSGKNVIGYFVSAVSLAIFQFISTTLRAQLGSALPVARCLRIFQYLFLLPRLRAFATGCQRDSAVVSSDSHCKCVQYTADEHS